MVYIVGVGFFITTNIVLTPFDDFEENFINVYEMNKYSPIKRAIAMCYFSFTTLSSVGLGDFVPISDGERTFVCFMIFIGVAVYSYVGLTY